MDVSNSEKERSCVSGGDSGGGGDDDDEDDDVGGGGENRSGHRYKRDFRRATKEVVMFPFRKAKKLQQQQRQLKQQQNPPNGNHVCSGSGGGAIKVSRRGKRMMGCCLCLKQPLTLESPLDSHSSDPNNPDFFCYDSLKNLIENSDFYTKECNTHVDIICPHPD